LLANRMTTRQTNGRVGGCRLLLTYGTTENGMVHIVGSGVWIGRVNLQLNLHLNTFGLVTKHNPCQLNHFLLVSDLSKQKKKDIARSSLSAVAVTLYVPLV
jgi:hypothetical protein